MSVFNKLKNALAKLRLLPKPNNLANKFTEGSNPDKSVASCKYTIFSVADKF